MTAMEKNYSTVGWVERIPPKKAAIASNFGCLWIPERSKSERNPTIFSQSGVFVGFRCPYFDERVSANSSFGSTTRALSFTAQPNLRVWKTQCPTDVNCPKFSIKRKKGA